MASTLPSPTSCCTPCENSFATSSLESLIEAALQGVIGTDILGYINVRSAPYSAVGDGVADDTAAVQSALTALSTLGGGALIFPKGTYLVDSLIAPSNVILVGASSGASILAQKSGAVYVLSINPGNAGTSNPADNTTNVVISNLGFSGRLLDDGFSEHHHLLNINAATNVLVDNCEILNPQGDAIYIGSGNTGGIERHNQNIGIRRCRIDGTNKTNRNGISIIDCDGLLIEDCYLTRLSAVNMPGPIDGEPDNIFNIQRNITIRNNTLIDNGGSNAAIGFYIDPKIAGISTALTTPFSNIQITNNHLFKFIQHGIYTRLGATSPAIGLLVSGNYIDGDYPNSTANSPIYIEGVTGAVITNNACQNCAGSISLGLAAAIPCSTLQVIANRFTKIGQFYNSAMEIFDLTYSTISENIFVDCGSRNGAGVPSGGYIIRFKTGTSSYLNLDGNLLLTTDNPLAYGIKKEADHTFSGWFTKRANQLIGLLGDDAVASISSNESVSIGIQAAAGSSDKVTIEQRSESNNSTALFSNASGAQPGTGYSGYFSKSGASGRNVALYGTATGGTVNVGLEIGAGWALFDDLTGFGGVTTPTSYVSINAPGTDTPGSGYLDFNLAGSKAWSFRVSDFATSNSNLVIDRFSSGVFTPVLELNRLSGLSTLYGGCELVEITDPAAPVADHAIIYVRDTGGKTQLCVRFPTGAVQVITTEP